MFSGNTASQETGHQVSQSLLLHINVRFRLRLHACRGRKGGGKEETSVILLVHQSIYDRPPIQSCVQLAAGCPGQVFLDQMSYIISPRRSRSRPGSHPSWVCPEIGQKEVPRTHSSWMPKPSQLPPLKRSPPHF